MKVVFLDIDGVLNNKEFLKDRDDLQVCDPKNVKNFNKIVEEIDDLKIVVSSSWRIGRSLEELIEILREKDVKGEIIDKTPDMTAKFDATRSNEIQAWLNGNDVDKFVILDDNPISLPLSDNHIRTSFTKGGLSSNHVDKVKEVLEDNEG